MVQQLDGAHPLIRIHSIALEILLRDTPLISEKSQPNVRGRATEVTVGSLATLHKKMLRTLHFVDARICCIVSFHSGTRACIYLSIMAAIFVTS